jgi:hypothetical protein
MGRISRKLAARLRDSRSYFRQLTEQTSGVPQDRDHPLQLRTPGSSLTTPASGYRHLRLRFAPFFGAWDSLGLLVAARA